ncbi:Argonaute siRNA chaperone complex subunit Arb1-domain-containing protein [Dendryphion nanum]|uniref:Argonaute siRNA chaperone complex subunit Arb1-domain-containing protein n=1 Tax=Dendryphion nanum TaxID=256645 RepID=A0A9P9DBS6_9PLEO|nr:Argonaute siRNA chaperone complex subunit Arb1-domain-containing protein [Dendryphion nanum]
MESQARGQPEAEQPEAEHPDAPRVRRQVEFYFSDDNLITDLHLLQCCGGRENLPVSISRIRGFRRMRQFKDKKMVVAALRKSTFLEVTEDGKHIKRKVPLRGKCLLDPDFLADGQEDDEIAYDPRSKRAVQHPVPLLPQEKKVLPPGVTKAMLKPTGFEDNHTEGPLAPAEAEEELAMYDPDKHFLDRMELAIQRFKQKRRMHEMYAKIFNKWMRFGGVDSEPRMFGGVSRQEMKDMTAEEIARSTATHHIPWDRDDPKKWSVDFVGVAEAFLSSYYPMTYSHIPSQVKIACQVLRSFFQYLIFHGVCPEYNQEIELAKKLCDKADFELPLVGRAGIVLPGAFNVAASTIFKGHHSGIYTGASEWFQQMDQDEKDRLQVDSIGMQDEKALATFKTGVTIFGTDDQVELLYTTGPALSGLRVMITEDVNLEVVSIAPSSRQTRDIYTSQNALWRHKYLDLAPLGKLFCKPIVIANSYEYDLPPSVDPSDNSASLPSAKEYEFWVEDEVLEECFVGMKMEATVLTLEGGVVVLDRVKAAMCSFYKWLPNELWMARKPKEVKVIKKFGDEEEEGEGEGGRGEEQVAKGEFSDEEGEE